MLKGGEKLLVWKAGHPSVQGLPHCENIFVWSFQRGREDLEAAKGWAAAGDGLRQPLGARNLHGSLNKEQASPGS